MAGGIHINRPSSTRYHAMVKASGCRKWHQIGGRKKSLDTAARTALRALLSDSYWTRACVAFTADYYDPQICLEIRSR